MYNSAADARVALATHLISQQLARYRSGPVGIEATKGSVVSASSSLFRLLFKLTGRLERCSVPASRQRASSWNNDTVQCAVAAPLCFFGKVEFSRLRVFAGVLVHGAPLSTRRDKAPFDSRAPVDVCSVTKRRRPIGAGHRLRVTDMRKLPGKRVAADETRKNE